MRSPADVLAVGDEVEAVVVEFREAEHKISLSVKALDNAGSSRFAKDEDVADVDIAAYTEE